MVAFDLIGRPSRQRVTSVDVARHAGVSQSTVSLVFSGKAPGRVSEATQDRVRRAARELGYRPNVAAQALRLGTSRAIALLVPDITNPFFTRVLRGAQRAAQDAGYTVVLVDTAKDRRGRSSRSRRSGRVPRTATCCSRSSSRRTWVPISTSFHGDRGPPPSLGALRRRGGAEAAFGHLLELGHRHIGHLAASFDSPTFHMREAARRRMLAEAGVDPGDLPRATTPIAIEAACEAAGPLLDERPTGVFCDDDLIAAGLYMAARERGLRIPKDLSVVGFDDMDFARALEPPLTTVALDGENIGATAFELLEGRMAGRRTREGG